MSSETLVSFKKSCCEFSKGTYKGCNNQWIQINVNEMIKNPIWSLQSTNIHISVSKIHLHLEFFPVDRHTESKTSSQVSKTLNTFSALYTFCNCHFALNTVLCIRQQSDITSHICHFKTLPFKIIEHLNYRICYHFNQEENTTGDRKRRREGENERGRKSER